MSMRTHRLTTYLQAHQAHSLIDFLDQVREVLMQAYGVISLPPIVPNDPIELNWRHSGIWRL